MCIYRNFPHEELHDPAEREHIEPREALKRYLFFQIPRKQNDQPIYRKDCRPDVLRERFCLHPTIAHSAFGNTAKESTRKECRNCNAWAREWRGKTKDEVGEAAIEATARAEQDYIDDLKKAISLSLEGAPQPSSTVGQKRKMRLSEEAQLPSQDAVAKSAYSGGVGQISRPVQSTDLGGGIETQAQERASEQSYKRLKLRGAEHHAALSTPSASPASIEQKPAEYNTRSSSPGPPQASKTVSPPPGQNPTPPSSIVGDSRLQRSNILARCPVPLANILRKKPESEWQGVTESWLAAQKDSPSASEPASRPDTPALSTQATRRSSRTPASSSSLDRSPSTRLKEEEQGTPVEHQHRGSQASLDCGDQNPFPRTIKPDPRVKSCIDDSRKGLFSAAALYRSEYGSSTSPGLVVDEDEEIAFAIQDGSFDRATSAFITRNYPSISNPKTPEAKRSPDRVSNPPYETPATSQHSLNSSSQTLVNSSPLSGGTSPLPSPWTQDTDQATTNSAVNPGSSASPLATTQQTPPTTQAEHESITRQRRINFQLLNERARLTQELADERSGKLERQLELVSDEVER